MIKSDVIKVKKYNLISQNLWLWMDSKQVAGEFY